MSASEYTGLIIGVLPFIILGAHFADKWYLSLGKLLPVYLLTIIGSLCTVAYNYTLWIDMNRHNTSIFVFSANSIWTIAMAAKGIIRLTKETKTKRLPSIPMNRIACPAKYKKEKQ